MNLQPPTDELLCAFLDGELDGPDHESERQRVQAWLLHHPEDAARLRLWAADAEALRARMASMLDEPVPAALRDAVLGAPGHRAQRLWPALAATFVCGLVAGSLLMQFWLSGPSEQLAAGTRGGWIQRAALAHKVYVPEPRHAVEVKAQEEHLARWLTRRIEVPVKLFDLADQGFSLVGGRLLPDGTGKSAQLMYQDAQGLRVTVYLRKPDHDAPTAFRYEQQGEIGMFYWIEAGAGYAMVGALPKERLLALARSVHEQLVGSARPP